MILELNISLELTKNKKGPLCPQATSLGIFLFIAENDVNSKRWKGL